MDKKTVSKKCFFVVLQSYSSPPPPPKKKTKQNVVSTSRSRQQTGLKAYIFTTSFGGCFEVSRWLNRGREEESRGKRTENWRKEKGQNMKNTHLLGGCHVGVIFITNLGTFWDIWRVPKPPLANPLLAERAFRARVNSGVWRGCRRCMENDRNL